MRKRPGIQDLLREMLKYLPETCFSSASDGSKYKIGLPIVQASGSGKQLVEMGLRVATVDL